MKYREKDFRKLYDIYMTCKTHDGEPYSLNRFRDLLKNYDSIIDICERNRGDHGRVKEPLNEKEIKKIEYMMKLGIKRNKIPSYTGVSLHRMYKYYINPKKALGEIS